MNSLICAFGKKIQRLRSNYLDLLFKCQDIRVNIFTGLFNFNYGSFKFRQSDSIDINASFSLKLFLINSKYLKDNCLQLMILQSRNINEK